jgi:hypothetical protein
MSNFPRSWQLLSTNPTSLQSVQSQNFHYFIPIDFACTDSGLFNGYYREEKNTNAYNYQYKNILDASFQISMLVCTNVHCVADTPRNVSNPHRQKLNLNSRTLPSFHRYKYFRHFVPDPLAFATFASSDTGTIYRRGSESTSTCGRSLSLSPLLADCLSFDDRESHKAA